MTRSSLRETVKRFLYLGKTDGLSAVERTALYVIGHPVCHYTRRSCTDQGAFPLLAWCDPTIITHNVSLPESVFSTIRLDEPVVGCCGGMWDRFTEDIRDWVLYASLQERFLHGREWEGTEYYRDARSAIESGQTAWNDCGSMVDLRNQCRSIDRLYDSIRKHGYQPQVLETPFGNDPLPDELRVGIDRDGSILRVGGGKHRLILAQLLGVEKIPILIMLVHERWDALSDHENVHDAIRASPHLSRDSHPLLHKY